MQKKCLKMDGEKSSMWEIEDKKSRFLLEPLRHIKPKKIKNWGQARPSIQTMMNPMRSRRLFSNYVFAAFTLLEILLVIVVLGMVASVVGWQIATAVSRYAFQREIQ